MFLDFSRKIHRLIHFQSGNYTLNHGLAENLDEKCNELIESCDSGEFHAHVSWLWIISIFQKISFKMKNSMFSPLKMLMVKLVD